MLMFTENTVEVVAMLLVTIATSKSVDYFQEYILPL